MTTSFLVGNINPGSVASEFMVMILGLTQQADSEEHGTQFQGLAMKAHAGPYLDCERNVVVQNFLNFESTPDVLMFVDSDMHTDPDTLHRLAAMCTPERPVVGGWYPNCFPESGGYYPVAFNWQQTDDGPRICPIPNPTDDVPFEVDCVGTGLMAIHRSLLVAMCGVFDPPTPWFAEVALHGSQMGEDVTFCARVKTMRHPVIFAPAVKAFHWKPIRMHPDTHFTATAPSVAGSITTTPSPVPV